MGTALSFFNSLVSMTSSYQSNHDELFRRLDDQMRSYRKTMTQPNEYSNKKLVSKAEIKQASQFLHTQHNRLSNIESSFPQLVDLLLEKDQDKLSLNTLSNQMRHLHSLHAKQILHIESLLVSQFGYQNSYLKEDTNTSSVIQQHQKTKLNQMLLQTRTRNEEIYFEQDIVGGPLSRLSEATYETDATVTPMSMSLNSVGLSLSGNPYSGSRRKRTPGGSFISIREHDDENSHGGGMKLEQELDMETEERGTPPKSSFQKDDLPKTPNLKELQLRYVNSLIHGLFQKFLLILYLVMLPLASLRRVLHLHLYQIVLWIVWKTLRMKTKFQKMGPFTLHLMTVLI